MSTLTDEAGGAMESVDAVVFDIGETLVDETRYWEGWARWLGVPLPTLLGALGAVISERRSHRDVFDWMAADDPRGLAVDVTLPGFDLADAEAVRRGDPDDDFNGPAADWPTGVDLYPDAITCIDGLRARGVLVGVAGNQPSSVESRLRHAGVRADFVASLESWACSKPSPEFFDRVAAECACPANAIAYVGDRVDFDVMPAIAAGMLAIHIRRGPWGVIQSRWPEAGRATRRIETLADVPSVLNLDEHEA